MPATATPTATWRRLAGEWCVQVPHALGDPTLEAGTTVTVIRRDGTREDVALGAVVRDDAFRATYRYSRPQRQAAVHRPLPTPPLGTHVLEADGEAAVIRVQRTRRGRIAAWTMNRTSLTATGRARWIYQGNRPFAALSTETLITEEQARDIGGRFGFCVNCGRTLTVDESIDRGIGPVCWRRIRANRALAEFAAHGPPTADMRAELTDRIERARRLAAQLEEAGIRGMQPADETEAAELLDDNTDPDDDLAVAAGAY